MLLAGAGCCSRASIEVLRIDPGFNADGVLTGSLESSRRGLTDDAAVRNVSGRILERIRAVPGVIAAGMTSTMPMAGQHSDSVIIAEGYQMAPGESLISPSRCMAAGYFEAMQTELRAGRLFDARDSRRRRRPRSSLTSSSRASPPGQNPLGQHMYFPTTATT